MGKNLDILVKPFSLLSPSLWILVISLLVHFVYLSHPNQVVFDEVHWGKYISGYCCNRQNIFDVHPPHGKILVAAFAWLTGYRGGQEFETIGTPYSQVDALAVRFLPALAGAFVPVVAFQLLRLWQISISVALLGGFLFVFENGILVQSRVMGLYPFLLLSMLLSLLFWEKTRTTSKNLYLYATLAGISAGFCVGLQFTGLLSILLITLLFLADLVLKRTKNSQVDSLSTHTVPYLITLFSFCFVYLIGWKLHFILLTNPGFGDAFYRNTGDFFTDLVALHKIMFTSSYHLTTSHPDASPWWSWPFMKKPIFYWVHAGQSMYFLGNPTVWWGGSLAFVVFTIRALFRKKMGQKEMGSRGAWISFISMIMAFIPLTGMKRVLFLYHFLTPLCFAVLFCLTQVSPKWFAKPLIRCVIYTLLLLGFLWIAPISYGLAMPNWYWHTFPWAIYH